MGKADFEDDDLANQGDGVFAGDAVREFGKVATAVDPKSGLLRTRCTCNNCGRKNEIYFTWEEVIVGSQSLVPQNWNVGQGTLYPNVGCALGNCHVLLNIHYTPDELQRYVQMGVASGVLDPRKATQIAQQARAAAGR
ncbi:MAG TPA: hypothetical protein VK571_11020 [Gemmatimonadaceae bacterium]|nr:hypothetical protein [Gemmatimonadaceae bacterium]